MHDARQIATVAADMAMKLSEVLSAASQALPADQRAKLHLASQSNDACLFWLRTFLINEDQKEQA